MQTRAIPHFRNELGVSRIAVGVKKFMCLGASPPNDHPDVFLDMGAATQIICPYCDTVYSFDPQLGERCDPPQCADLVEPRNDRDEPTAVSQDSREAGVESTFEALWSRRSRRARSLNMRSIA
ncbi:zinc-finger domain-containing protein [Methylocystis sp. IM2]|uniref:zinc-finger domain-containing protein n=1 Tax=unclassified Methylocystis TaxID=2625913 RepID=UPI0030F6432C